MTRHSIALLLAFSIAGTAAAQSLKQELTIATPAAVGVTAVSPDGTQITGACRDGKLRVWALPSGQLLRTLNLELRSRPTMAYSHNGNRLAIGAGQGPVHVFDAASGALVQELATGPHPLDNLALSPDGSLLAAAPLDQPVQLWDANGRKLVAELKSQFGGSTALAFSPDGKYLASASGDTVVQVFDAHTGELRSRFDGLLLESFELDFTPDSKKLVIAGADKLLVAIDPATGKLLKQSPKQPDPIFGLRTMGDGITVVALCLSADHMSDARATLAWNMETGEVKMLVSGQNFNGGGTLADGRLILTSSEKDSVKVWSVR